MEMSGESGALSSSSSETGEEASSSSSNSGDEHIKETEADASNLANPLDSPNRASRLFHDADSAKKNLFDSM